MKKCFSGNSSFPPPADLSSHAVSLWNSLVPRRASSPERLELLTLALRALDRCDQLREQLRREGLVVETPRTKCKHAHPALAILEKSERQFRSVWKQLNLEWAPDLDGRPPEPGPQQSEGGQEMG